jgi:iron complex transport system substrate-binding protein
MNIAVLKAWLPAFAGMTTTYSSVIKCRLLGVFVGITATGVCQHYLLISRNFSKQSRTLISCALLFFCTHALALPPVLDDNQHLIHLSVPAQRIISLAPNLTEILFAIGAGAKIKGVCKGSDYPVAAKSIPVIADASSINIEAILALHPDLVVAWQGGNPAQALVQLQQWGIPVYVARFKEIDDISHTMTNLAILTGTTTSAAGPITQFKQGFAVLRRQYARSTPVRVFYSIGQEPLFTVSRNSTINQVITLCGGRNIFANTIQVAPQVSREAVLASDPQVMISSDADSSWRKYWIQWPNLAAVRYKNLFVIPPDFIFRPAPRLLRGAQMLCRDLQLARERIPKHGFVLD